MNKIVKAVIHRPLGSYHPKHNDIYYFVNYGYIPGIIAPNGDELYVFRGLDEKDIQNYFCVPEYMYCLKKFVLLESVLG